MTIVRFLSARLEDPATPATMGGMLQARGVSVEVGGRILVADLALTIMPKDKVGLVGRNGAGKTSLFKVLGGADRKSTRLNSSHT